MGNIEFNQLLVSNKDFLKPFALNLTKESELAKDLVQETLYKALRYRDNYNVGTNIKAWLYTIMRNIFINDYRKKAKQQTILDYTENDFLLNSNQLSVNNASENSLKLKEIYAAIDKLPLVFKNPFMLYYEGYKYNEIADIYKEPLGTIKSRIFFARKILKQQLENN